MKRVIWKFPISGPAVWIEMPRGAEILTIQLQGEIPTVWAMVDPDAPKVRRKIVILGTGHVVASWPPDRRYKYINTFQVGPFVFHLFDTGEEEVVQHAGREVGV